jgi:hypothetical protein
VVLPTVSCLLLAESAAAVLLEEDESLANFSGCTNCSSSSISENKKMIASEDFNTWVRISNITEKFLYIPKTLGFYLAHENNISNKEDMSLNMECAYSEFMHLLSPSQQNKINSNFCYMRGRQAYVKNQHANAIKDLYFVVCHGTTLYMIKSIYMIMIIILKKYLSKKL